MATPETGLDLVALTKALGDVSGKDTSTEVSTSKRYGADLEALTKIGAGVTKTIGLQAMIQQSTMEVEKALANQQTKILTGGATSQLQAGEAAADLAEQKTRGELQSQEAARIQKAASGLVPEDPTSTLRKSIATFNAAMDKRTENIQAASDRRSMRFMDVLRGKKGFGDYIEAKIIDPASTYEEAADAQGDIAKNEQARIVGLQGMFSGQTQVNAAAQKNLTEDSIRQVAEVQRASFAKVASDLQIQALTKGTEHLKQVMSASQHVESVALASGGLAVTIENSKRQWESLNISKAKQNPEDYAAQVRIGAAFLGNPGASNMTADYISKYANNPSAKADLDTLAQIGVMLSGQAVLDPTAALPPVLGTAGEAVFTLERTRGRLPEQMAVVQNHLNTLAADTSYDAVGKALKPAERLAFINVKADNWLASNSKDIDATDLYGKPHIADIITMPSMQTPEVAAFTERVLKPLGAQNVVLPLNVIVQAARTSGLSQQEIDMGLHKYAMSARALRGAIAQPQVAGLRAATSIPYTANVDTGSLFGSKISVDFTNLAAVVDANHRYNMYTKAKTHSLTILDAAAATAVIPGAKQ